MANNELRRDAELGHLLGAAVGYRVLAPDGRELGRVDHIVYRQHADHPDEIVVHRRWLRRPLHISFAAVTTVAPRDQTIRTTSDVDAAASN